MKKKSNEKIIEKTIETSDFLNGGLLNPEQQKKFIVLVKKYSALLPMVRFESIGVPKIDLDKLHVSEPVTESADENTNSGNLSGAKFNKVEVSTKKLRSAWNISTETLQGNIEQNNFEDTIMNAMIARIATDLELLAIQGDTAIDPLLTDPTSRLLRRLDGWAKQTDGGQIFDVGGISIQRGIFSEMKRMLPKQHRGDPGLRWFVSDTIITDWQDYLATRLTAVGDAALGGSSVAPYGIPMVSVNLIPDDLPLTVAGVSAGQCAGTEFGPFVIVTGANKVKLDIDDGGAVTVTIPAGTHEAVTLAKYINDDLGAIVASDDGDGQLLLKSTTTGAASEVDVQAIAGDAYDILGLTVGVYAGAAAGGSVLEGSFIWLTNPRNLIYAVLDATRIYSEFNKNFDRVESIVYNQVDANVENIEAIVKCTNLRRRASIL